MRLPDDYEDHGNGLTPTVVSAIVAVTIFVVVILQHRNLQKHVLRLIQQIQL